MPAKTDTDFLALSNEYEDLVARERDLESSKAAAGSKVDRIDNELASIRGRKTSIKAQIKAAANNL